AVAQVRPGDRPPTSRRIRCPEGIRRPACLHRARGRYLAPRKAFRPARQRYSYPARPFVELSVYRSNEEFLSARMTFKSPCSVTRELAATRDGGTTGRVLQRCS